MTEFSHWRLTFDHDNFTKKWGAVGGRRILCEWQRIPGMRQKIPGGRWKDLYQWGPRTSARGWRVCAKNLPRPREGLALEGRRGSPRERRGLKLLQRKQAAKAPCKKNSENASEEKQLQGVSFKSDSLVDLGSFQTSNQLWYLEWIHLGPEKP